MSCFVLVYREGDTSVVRGVPCEFKRVTVGEAELLKMDGWVGSVYELYCDSGKPSKKEDELCESIADIFDADPTRLTKDELKEYGKEFGLNLSKRMLEENMISAIKEAKEAMEQ
jgi:hypothetical protein